MRGVAPSHVALFGGDPKPRIELFAEPAALAHRTDGAGMGAVARGRNAAMDAVSGQIEKVIWCSSGTSPMPILKRTLRSAPITCEMSGTRPQNRSRRGAAGSWRGSAPRQALRRGRAAPGEGRSPDHSPRDASRREEKRPALRTRGVRQRRRPAPSRCARAAVSGSGQVARIAQTAVLGTGVKPSPLPEPQSFQKPIPVDPRQGQSCERHLPERPEPRRGAGEAVEAEADGLHVSPSRVSFNSDTTAP